MATSPTYNPNLIEKRFGLATRTNASVRRAASEPRDRRALSPGLDLQDRHRRGRTRHGPVHARLALLRSGLLRRSTASECGTPATPRRPRRSATSTCRPASSTRSTRSSATSARRSAPATCSTTRSASASTRCRRSRRRRASVSRAGSTTTDDLFDPEAPGHAGRPGPARVRPGAPRGDAAADGDGRGDDRQPRRRPMRPQLIERVISPSGTDDHAPEARPARPTDQARRRPTSSRG